MSMSSSVVRWLIVVGAVLALPMLAHAQEATVSGTVTDTTGGVLPGVTVTAVHEATGNTFVAVTDERGAYRIAVRVGAYRVTAELAGFTTVTRSNLDLLLGQQALVNLQMTPSGVQESVTVTGEAPLVDTTNSTLGGNIDPRQMSELPVNGRNWMDLSLLAVGSRANAVAEAPLPRDRGDYQINIDGQQVTNVIAGSSFGQPRFSRDAIAEFEFVANRFDATQGRSSGVQVNAVTKSGTNTPAGTVSGYFRDDRFNAADFVTGRVLPYSNQEVSTTFGGPIRKDRIHVFGNYEYEREPQTFTYTTPYPRFNFDLTGTRREHKGGVRLDFQFSPQTHLSVRGNKWSHLLPYDQRYTGGGDKTPSSTTGVNRYMDEIHTVLTQVLGSRALNEVKVGYAGFHWDEFSPVQNPNSPTGKGSGAQLIQLRGFIVGMQHTAAPQDIGQETYSVRDDFAYSATKGGRHNLKLGGEYLYNLSWLYFCSNCIGTIDAQGGPIPANIEDLFPNMFDASTWNLAPLSSITRKYSRGVGDFNTINPRHEYAAWVQDDWTITRRLTLNLGLRYDLYDGTFAEEVELLPFLRGNRPLDTNNLGPRLGFAFSLNDRTVIRGGFGKYFAEVSGQPAFFTRSASQQVSLELLNDGRPDFAANPYNGPAPTYEEALRFVQQLGQRRNISSMASPDLQIPYSYQTSIGVQRQLGDTIGVEADYVFTGTRHDLFTQNINLAYDPVTAVNYPFTDISHRPYPDWGLVNLWRSEGWSNYHALQTAFTKRFSQRWQASGTYLLSGLWDAEPSPAPFKVAPDLGGEYSLAITDQRHRAVFNGIWQLGYGFQLSGLYFFGSGQRFGATYGGDLRQTGGTGGRLRPNGTIVPRNNLVGKPLHRVDVRVQRRFRLVGRARVDGILELFNLLNHANYGSYVTQESNRNYRQPSSNTNVAYQPRMLQLGFRATF